MRVAIWVVSATFVAACNTTPAVDSGADDVSRVDASTDSFETNPVDAPLVDVVSDSMVPADVATDVDASDGGVQVPTGRGFATLAEYHLFVGNGSTQEPAPGVIPYDVNSPLFSDSAAKHRFVYVPSGEHIGFDPAGRWTLPVGAVLVKTFAYPIDQRMPSLGERLVETRLLIRQATGFRAETYRWNDAQTGADRTVAGADVPVEWIDLEGVTQRLTFRMPNLVECERCHGNADPTRPNPMDALGLRTDQLNRDHVYAGSSPENQIAHLASLGLFDVTPPTSDALPRLADPFGSEPVEARARSYLHANCAHCHNPSSTGASGLSGLWLDIEATDPYRLGVCKIPTSATDTGGRLYDIVPGHSEESVLPYRMSLTGVAAAMPPLGRSIVDARAVTLIQQWIDGMTPPGCM